jgi:hypothetical protein
MLFHMTRDNPSLLEFPISASLSRQLFPVSTDVEFDSCGTCVALTLTVLASFGLFRRLFSKRKETKLNNLKVLFPPIFLEMKSRRAHEYVAALNLHSYILTHQRWCERVYVSFPDF